jgi:EAL domain-containing protein (putative c-di-GMP-specific phosphodiesterase class I)
MSMTSHRLLIAELLQNFLDALKIDRAFVSRLTPGIRDTEMVSTIIAVAATSTWA